MEKSQKQISLTINFLHPCLANVGYKVFSLALVTQQLTNITIMILYTVDQGIFAVKNVTTFVGGEN